MNELERLLLEFGRADGYYERDWNVRCWLRLNGAAKLATWLTERGVRLVPLEPEGGDKA